MTKITLPDHIGGKSKSKTRKKKKKLEQIKIFHGRKLKQKNMYHMIKIGVGVGHRTVCEKRTVQVTHE
jgi:hypothetical protein